MGLHIISKRKYAYHFNVCFRFAQLRVMFHLVKEYWFDLSVFVLANGT